MKKYKTWEVVKMLEENPELSFQSKSKEWEMRVKDNKIVFTSKGLVCDICGVALNTEWTLMQQSVTFMEALNSGKRVYVEHELISNNDDVWEGISIIKQYWEDLKNGRCCKVDGILNALSWMYNSYDLREIINNGKWYIEEEIENEI